VKDELLKKAKKSKLRLFYGNDPRLKVVKVPFGIPQLDTILGGGMPLGRMTLVVGNFGVGKTFFAQTAMANFQKQGYSAAYVDTERRYDPEFFKASGIDVDLLLVSQPSSGENALDTCVFLIGEQVGIVVLDSVAALVPTVELEGNMEDSTIAALARLFNKGLRKVADINIASEDLEYRGTAFIAINQMRSGIGPFTSYSLPGGQGQQYFSSILLRVMRGPRIEENGERVGFYMKFTTDKNNLASWPQTCQLPFRFEGFIDTVGGLVELAIDLGVIIQKGGYFSVPEVEGTRNIQGKLAVIEELKQNSELFERIKEMVNKA